MSGGFPLDLILFGMVAAFLVLRLRGVLGRRQGFERPPRERPVPAPGAPPLREAEALPPSAVAGSGAHQVVPEARSPVGQALQSIQQMDRAFDPNAFLAGAEGAFRMIVAAFASGDRATLRDLLSEDTYAGFEQAVTAREQAGERQRTEVRAILETAITAAELRGSTAEVTVRIVSEQVNVTTDAKDEVVAGTEAVTEVTDIWTFQRDLRSSDPTWKLVGTQSA
ncbi:Tim44/TimA family putative adaptor protein [Roseomonas sp. E05]|uniref:Tim44/TimA family putative adaptor protein n=1 Tax=Roseomonas sp. E05 TaxID=3046310 RepID=UPI0024B9D54A|nr:Tim44/TimA family putative adaptor protein [Roseomonas sp. E05]MDJ0387836.1 Tim44/TimA family putative adaptor protein [Roseomonas sp. E05]